MRCPNCGAEISKEMIPEEYRPLSMWGYFGYQLLFSIPMVGQILLIVMCFAPANKNLKNFARSYFCYAIIILIIAGIILAATGALAFLGSR